MPAFFDQLITVYGRKPVLEVLQDTSLNCYRLHFADSNKPAPILREMEQIANSRGVEICTHGKKELSRISRKGAQDQGVAVDVLCPGFTLLDDYLALPRPGLTSPGLTSPGRARRLLAVDGVTNPQNAGMLVRSAVAGGIDGILWPREGNAALGPLAVKASAGTLFRAPLIRCKKLADALRQCQRQGHRVCILAADADHSIYDKAGEAASGDTIYVLGNESSGVSLEISELADAALSIPMHNGVESLNVAVTAALIAYLDR